jgi:hypothetical protein
LQLSNKGAILQQSVIPAEKVSGRKSARNQKQIRAILKQEGMTNTDEQHFIADPKREKHSLGSKEAAQGPIHFRTFTMKAPEKKGKDLKPVKLLLVKETDSGVLDYHVYFSR